METPAVEHQDGFDLIHAEQLQHLEQKIDVFVGLNILVELEGITVATLIEPRKGIHGDPFFLESGQVFFRSCRLK